ncbi:hypothetical protein RB595_009860 [Gaeumannomyces hyphopodioides]
MPDGVKDPGEATEEEQRKQETGQDQNQGHESEHEKGQKQEGQEKKEKKGEDKEQDGEDREEYNEEGDDRKENDEHVDANTGIGSTGDIEEDSDDSRTLSLHTSNEDHAHGHQDDPGGTLDGDPPASVDSSVTDEHPPFTPSSTSHVSEDALEEQLEEAAPLAGTVSGEQLADIDKLKWEMELRQKEARGLQGSLDQLTRVYEASKMRVKALKLENGRLKEENAALLELKAPAVEPETAKEGNPDSEDERDRVLELQQDNWNLVAQQDRLMKHSQLENNELERSVGDLRTTIREKDQQLDALGQFAKRSEHRGGGLTQLPDPTGTGEMIKIGELGLRFSQQQSRLVQLGAPDALLDGPGGQREGLVNSLLRADDALHDAFDDPVEHHTVAGTAPGYQFAVDPKTVQLLVEMVELDGDPGPVRELFKYLKDEANDSRLADHVWKLMVKLSTINGAEAPADPNEQPLGDAARLGAELRESKAEHSRLQEKLRRFMREATLVDDLKRIVAANQSKAEADEGQDPTERKLFLADSIIRRLGDFDRAGQGYQVYDYSSSSSGDDDDGDDNSSGEEQSEAESSLEYDPYAGESRRPEDAPGHLTSTGEAGTSTSTGPDQPRHSAAAGGPKPSGSGPSGPMRAGSLSAAQEIMKRHGASLDGPSRTRSLSAAQGAAARRNIHFTNNMLLARYAEVERLKRVLGETQAEHSSCTEAIDKLTTERDAANDRAKGLEGQLGELRASQQRTTAAAAAPPRASWLSMSRPWFLGGGQAPEPEPEGEAADDGAEEQSLVHSKDLGAELARLHAVVEVLVDENKLPEAEGTSLQRSLKGAEEAARELSDQVKKLERSRKASGDIIDELRQKHWRANAKIDELQKVLRVSISKATHEESRNRLREAQRKITLLRSAKSELRGALETSKRVTQEIQDLKDKAETKLGEAAKDNEDLATRADRLTARYEGLGQMVQSAVEAIAGTADGDSAEDEPAVEGESDEDREHRRIILDLERAMRSHRERVSLEGHAGEIAKALREAREVHAEWRLRLKRRRRDRWPFASTPETTAAVQRAYGERKTELAAVLSSLGQVRAELGKAGAEVAKDAKPRPWRLRLPSILCRSCESQAAGPRPEGTAWQALAVILIRPFFSLWVVVLWLLAVAAWFFQAASRVFGKFITHIVDRVAAWDEELPDDEAVNGEGQSNDNASATGPPAPPVAKNEERLGNETAAGEEQSNDEAGAASLSAAPPTAHNGERPGNEAVVGEEQNNGEASTTSPSPPPGTLAAFPAVPQVEIVEAVVLILLILVGLLYSALSRERQLWLGANGVHMRRAYTNEIRSRGDAVYSTWTPFLKIDFRLIFEPALGNGLEWLSSAVERAVDGVRMLPAVAWAWSSNTIQLLTGAVRRAISDVWGMLAIAWAWSSHTVQWLASAVEGAVGSVSRMTAVTGGWLGNLIRRQFSTVRRAVAWERLRGRIEWLLDDFWADIGGAWEWLPNALRRMIVGSLKWLAYTLGDVWVRLTK